MQKDDHTREFATSFAVYISADEQSFIVDSQWLNDHYRTTSTGSIVTFQIWAADPATTERLVIDIFSKLAARGSLVFQNKQPPLIPQTFIATAAYNYGKATLTMINRSQISKTIVYTAVTWSAPTSESEAHYAFIHTIPPGVSVVQLPLQGILNGVIYADEGGVVDKVYVGDGVWAAFDDVSSGGTSQAMMRSANCATYNGAPDALLVAGCATLTGTVTSSNGYIGVYRTLTSNDAPLDLEGRRFLRFNVRGDNKVYHVKLETQGVDHHNYQYVYTFTAPSTWQTMLIPLDAFVPWGNNTPLDPHAMKAVTWATIGGPHASIELHVDQIAFLYEYRVALPIILR